MSTNGPEDSADSAKTIAIKDFLPYAAVLIACIYAFGYFIRSIGLGRLQVGELSVTKEGALMTGTVCALLVYYASVLWYLLLGVNSFLNKNNRLKVFLPGIFMLLWVSDILTSPDHAFNPTWSGVVVFCWASLSGLAGSYFLTTIQTTSKDALRGAGPFAAPYFAFAITAICATGGACIDRIASDFGGFNGPSVHIETAGHTHDGNGKIVAEDSSWLIIWIREQGVLRLAKSEIRIIKPLPQKNGKE